MLRAVGDAKCTYGTGAFILMNTGDVARWRRSAGLLTTVGVEDPRDETGVLRSKARAFIAGAAVQWLRDGLGFFTSAGGDRGDRAHVRRGFSGGVVVVPAFTPGWARRTGAPTRAA